MALRLNPDIKNYIERIVFMGMGVVKHDTKPPKKLELGKSYLCSHSLEKNNK